MWVRNENARVSSGHSCGSEPLDGTQTPNHKNGQAFYFRSRPSLTLPLARCCAGAPIDSRPLKTHTSRSFTRAARWTSGSASKHTASMNCGTIEGAGGNFSWFLQHVGAAMVLEGVETNGYGVFKQRTPKAVTQSDGSTKHVKDTWITFSGPTTIQHPSYRKVPFNIASDSADLALLSDSSSSSQQRIARLLNKSLGSKKQDAGPSPAKPPGTRDDDLGADYDVAGAVAVSPDEARPWAHHSREDLWRSLELAEGLAAERLTTTKRQAAEINSLRADSRRLCAIVSSLRAQTRPLIALKEDHRMALEQLRSRHASKHDDLVRKTMEERERADFLMVRLSMKEQSLSESRAQNRSFIARIGKQQRDAPIDAMLQKMQLDAREGTIRTTLRSELAQANRLNGLGPLPEPASPAMLR